MKKRFLGVVLLCLFSGRLPAQSQTLDPTNFVVPGGGLASGYANFQLVGRFQEKSFPVLMADQMKTIMPMPLFREAPAGVYVSFNPQPDLLPDINQSVLRGLPFPLFTFNLSVPFLRVSESVNRRPAPPFVHEGNLKQTMINLILGYPVLILDTPALWTQVEYAEFMAPTLVIVQLGFGDVLQGAISGDPGQISSSSGFASDYQTIVDRVKGTHATVILMNVPDPVDTAYFTDLESAAAAYQTDSASLMAQFDLEASDRLSLGGLVEIGDWLAGRREGPLSARSVLKASTANTVRSAVSSFNSTIANTASEGNCLLFDLNSFMKQARTQGIRVGPYVLGGEYLQGFFSTDGLFLTPSGQAVLANRLLSLLNNRFGTDFSLVDVEATARTDDLVPKDAQSSERLLPDISSLPVLQR